MSILNNKRILVTGGMGFIGRHLVNKLLEMNNEVTIIDLSVAEIKFFKNKKKLKIIEGDLTNKDQLDKLKNIPFNYIFHLASGASVPNSVKDPELDFFSTAYATLKILQIALRKEVEKFIYLSTVSVYDINNKMPIDENAQIKVSSPFGASKLAGESYCYAFNRSYGLNTNVIRLFNAFGPGMNKYFIHDMINKFINNPQKVEVLGDGNQVRDYLYIDDVVDAIILVAEKGSAGDDYNLGSGQPFKVIDIVKKIATLMDIRDYEINLTNESWAGDIKEWYSNSKKIEGLGFKKRIDIDLGLKKTIDYLMINK